MAELWRPGGPWDDLGTTKDNLRSMLGFSIIFGRFRDPVLTAVEVPETKSRPMGVIWHAGCLCFGVLGKPGTILGRPWDIGEYKKGHFEVQA